MKLNIITDKEEINKVRDFDKKIRFTGFKVFNTPWAKDKYGNRDKTNLAVFVEFELPSKELYYWLISERELFELMYKISEIGLFNRKKDSSGTEFQKLINREWC